MFGLCFALALIFASSAAFAQNCPSYSGDYQLNFDPATKKMVICKYGDSLRDVCTSNSGTTCTAAQAGTVTYVGASTNRLRYCNGTNWLNMTCGTISTCGGTTAGTTTADANYAKYCDGTNWQALHNIGTCAGIGVLEATFTPTNAMLGDNQTMYAWERAIAISGDYMVVGARRNTQAKLRDGAAYVYKRSGTSWNFLKSLDMSLSGVNYEMGMTVTIDGDWIAVGSYGGNRVYLYNRTTGGADNWGYVKTITGGSYYAYSLDLKGDQLAVTQRNYHVSSDMEYVGRVYIYRRDLGGTNNWGQAAVITPPLAEQQDRMFFGSNVRIAGDTMVAGSYQKDEWGFTDAGAAYVYTKASGTDTWSFLKKIIRPDTPTANSDQFGWGLDIVDTDNNGTADRMVIAAFNADNYLTNGGMLYIYERNQGGTNNWGLLKQTTDTAMTSAGALGWSVAFNEAGTRIVAAAYASDQVATDAGAIAIFQKDQGGTNNWGFVNYLTASDGTIYDQMGQGVATSGNYVAGSAPYAGSTYGPGAAYVFFNTTGTTWTQQSKVGPPSNSYSSPRMGDSVALGGEYAATGMQYYGDTLEASRRYAEGAVNIYKRSVSGTWSLEKTVKPSTMYSDGAFGYNMDMTPEFLAVAAPADDAKGSSAGAVWLFGRNQGGIGNWGQIKRLTASDGSSSDVLSNANGISIDGGTVAAGAYGEDGTLVYPDNNAGAVYIYDRDTGGTDNWGETKKIPPPVQESVGQFGYSVDVSNDTLVAGANGMDSNGTNAGAAYVFYRDQGGAGNWGLIKTLAGAAANDQFGFDVSVSGDTMAISARYNDTLATDAGAVYIYERNLGGTNNWGQRKIVYPTTVSSNHFGAVIEINGDILVVGAPLDDANATDAGLVYVFMRNEGGTNNWGLVTTISADNPQAGDNFGTGVAVSGNVAAGSGIYVDGAVGPDSGGVYLYGCP